MSLTKAVAHLFDPDVRQRGQQYFRDGAAFIKKGNDEEVLAYVAGSDDYVVEINRDDNTLIASCTCPYYADRNAPCKHIWATLLAADQAGHLLSVHTNKRLNLELDEVGSAGDFDEDAEDADLPALGSVMEEFPAKFLSILGLKAPPAVHTKRVPRKPKETPPPWVAQLKQLREAQLRSPIPLRAGEATPLGETFWIIDMNATMTGGGLALETAARTRKKNGEWSMPKQKRLPIEELQRLPPEDQRIAALLIGARDSYGGYYYGSVPARWSLSYSASTVVLPEACRTGRCLLRLPDATLVPLTWDDGEPWRFHLVVKPDPEHKAYRVLGELRRGAERLSISQTQLLTAGGLVFWNERVARYEGDETFACILQFAQGGFHPVLAKDGPRFIGELLSLPSLPPLELPDELRFEEVSPPLQPRLKVYKPKQAWGREVLHADLSFDYGGRQVADGTPLAGIYLPESRQLVRRNPLGEELARARLGQLGVRKSYYYGGTQPYELKPKLLPKIVRDLTSAGWHVEAEGKLYRQPGDFKIEVTSGIDWFELHGEVKFDETTARLPALLAALKRGENTVQLDDGTFGILPEEWLKKYGMLAGLGTAQDDHLRFIPSQVGLLDALLAAQPEATCDAVFTQARERLRQFDGIAPASPPETFQGELRPYQRDGLGWLHFLRDFRFGGCLADDMGLGKTVQVLALLDARRQERAGPAGLNPAARSVALPSLVVVPRSLVFNWKQEAARFTPQLRVLDHTGSERIKGNEHFEEYDLVLTTYGTLRRDALHIKDTEFDYAILDEAQAIKNASTESAKAARLIRARHRLVMSGTPVENHLGELWSLFEFLNPGMLGSASVFRLTGAGGKQLDPEVRTLLARALRPFILRRTKEQVAKDLPQKTEQTLYCELEPAQRKQYDELKEHYRQSLLGLVDAQGLKKSQIQVLEALLRLRQAACHPGLLDRNQVKDPSAKLDALLAQLREVCDEGHKALVFSQFTSFLAILKDRLKKEGLTFEYLDGKTRDRQARVERFQTDTDCPLFLISLKAGGLGLNLTAAEYVFLLDPWWNPAVEAQAIDRTHRIGQTRPVFAYRLIAKDTVEEKVLELQKTKRDLADAIINADNSLIRNLEREDLELLLS